MNADLYVIKAMIKENTETYTPVHNTWYSGDVECHFYDIVGKSICAFKSISDEEMKAYGSYVIVYAGREFIINARWFVTCKSWTPAMGEYYYIDEMLSGNWASVSGSNHMFYFENKEDAETLCLALNLTNPEIFESDHVVDAFDLSTYTLPVQRKVEQ